jgi:hypothetical protein
MSQPRQYLYIVAVFARGIRYAAEVVEKTGLVIGWLNNHFVSAA